MQYILLDKWSYVNLTKVIDEIDPVEYEYPKFKPYEKEKFTLLMNAIRTSVNIEIINLSNFNFKKYDGKFIIYMFESFIRCKNLHTLYLQECRIGVSKVVDYMLNKLLSLNKIKRLNSMGTGVRIKKENFVETLQIRSWGNQAREFNCDNLITHCDTFNNINVSKNKTISLYTLYLKNKTHTHALNSTFNKLKTTINLEKIEIKIYHHLTKTIRKVNKLTEQPNYKYRLIDKIFKPFIDYKYYSNVKITADIKINDYDISIALCLFFVMTKKLHTAEIPLISHHDEKSHSHDLELRLGPKI
jgi:hypothetical protein